MAERSKQVADDDFPDDISWIRSYVIAETDGTLGSICIYQASNPEAVRQHAHRASKATNEDRLPARGAGATVVAPCMRRRRLGPAAAGGGGGEL